METPNTEHLKSNFFNQERIALFIFLFFALIIFVAQSLQYLNSRQIDKNYSDLINASSYDIKTVNSMLVHSSNIQRNAVNLLVKEDEIEESKFKKNIENFVQLTNEDLKKFDSSTFAIFKDKDQIKYINESYLRYKIRLDTFMQLVNNSEIDKASVYRLLSLRPSFQIFQDLQKDLSAQLTKDLIKESNNLTSYTNKSSLSLLLMGFSPVFFVLLVLIYFGIRLFKMRKY